MWQPTLLLTIVSLQIGSPQPLTLDDSDELLFDVDVDNRTWSQLLRPQQNGIRPFRRPSPLATPGNRLFAYLFKDYQKAIRPTLDAFRSTNVLVSPNLYSIIDADEGQETLAFSRWFQEFWTDDFLVWDPAEFGGIEEMLVDVSNVWVPDITIIEMLASDNAKTVVDFVSVLHNGTVRYSMNDIIRVYCKYDVANFPYDEQQCNVSYVSWEYPADQITVNALPSRHSNLAFYGKSTEWELVSYTWSNLSITDNSTISFDGVTYTIRFRRKPMFYVVSLVLPSFVITTLSLVGIFSPSEACLERKERITIGLTGSLAMAVVLMMLYELMPKSDAQFPLLGQYVLYQMVITGSGTLVAVMNMHIQANAASIRLQLPRWALRLLFINDSFEPKKLVNVANGHMPHANGSVVQRVNIPPTLVGVLLNVEANTASVRRLLEQQQQSRIKVRRARCISYRLDIALTVLFNLINLTMTVRFFRIFQ